jgi:hypothetical protein
MVPRSTATVDTIYATWTAKGVTVIEEPHDDVFGRTFVITDPDGNLIRVSPIDRSLRPEPSQAAWDNRMRSVPAVPEVVPVAGDVVQGGQPVEDDPLERSWKLFS